MSTFKAELKDISKVSKDIRIAFVVGDFNAHYTHVLEKQNREYFAEHGFKNTDSYFVPGAFEIPGFAKKLIEKDIYDLVIILWVVIRWETPHFDYVCNETARGVMNLNTMYETPVIFGLLTCNNDEQVVARINAGFAVSGLNLLAELEKIKE